MLADLGIHLLDVLGEVSGGRGGYQNHLPRFLLGTIIWSITLLSAWSVRKQQRHPRESLILIGMSIALFREASMFIGASFIEKGYLSIHVVTHFFPPLEVMTKVLSEIAIAAAFLVFLMSDSRPARRFGIASVACIVPLFFIAFWPWWNHIADGGSSLFASHWTGMLMFGAGAIITGYVVIQFARSNRKLHWIVCIPFALFFVDHLLSIATGVLGLGSIEILEPIRNTIHLAALPWFGYIYWREQADERRRLQRTLEQSSRLDMIGRLAAGVAHDFNNHLHVIMGYAEIGRAQAESNNRSAGNYENIVDSVERASALVSQLMAFHRENEDDNQRAIDVSELLSGLAPITKSLLGGSIQFNQVLDGRVALIVADRVIVEQMILNLIANARDAMPDGGRLTIHSEIISGSDLLTRGVERKPHVRLSITDNGLGMDRDTLHHASEPFFTTKHDSGGTGLGLASVFNLVNKLGGSINIDSNVGRGTTVTIDLPLADDEVEAEVVEESEDLARPGQGQLILIAEDNVANRHITAAHLSGMGYEVITAVDGVDAVKKALASDKRIDLMLFDISMPELTGYRARDQIVEKLGDIPVVFMTARMPGAHGTYNRFFHLSKPFHRRDLNISVTNALESFQGDS